LRVQKSTTKRKNTQKHTVVLKLETKKKHKNVRAGVKTEGVPRGVKRVETVRTNGKPGRAMRS